VQEEEEDDDTDEREEDEEDDPLAATDMAKMLFVVAVVAVVGNADVDILDAAVTTINSNNSPNPATADQLFHSTVVAVVEAWWVLPVSSVAFVFVLVLVFVFMVPEDCECKRDRATWSSVKNKDDVGSGLGDRWFW